MASFPWTATVVAVAFACGWIRPAGAQEWTTIHGTLRQESRQVSSSSMSEPLAADDWRATEDQRREMWREMLGLSPLPPRTPLQATVTGKLERGDYVVEKVHFQSVPGAYVIGNLYRPARPVGKLPAVLYLCGHSQGKVNPTYQAHPRWFAQHGYVALVLDPIQLGESQGFHHGTYRGGNWDWPSRGYTPAGTEVWNAMRALDYLETRPDVDGKRMGVTGLSGGGVISWCLGAADERVKVVVPVCQTGSIESVVCNRSTDGHCDCAFWINYYRWCWPDVGALIAPRALLIASGSEDVLWRPRGYRDVAERIRRQYASLEADDHFDLVEDLTPHGYTPKLNRAIFTWFNLHLKNDATPETDDVTDFVEPVENLLVFGGKPPKRDEMTRIDKLLVKQFDLPEITDEAAWLAHRKSALKRLRQTTFRHTLPQNAPRQREFRADGSRGSSTGKGDVFATRVFDSFDGMTVSIKTKKPGDRSATPVLAFAVQPDARSTFAGGGSSRPATYQGIATAAVEVRNTGATSVGTGFLWTARRSYPLLGQTLPERQVADLLAAIALVKKDSTSAPLAVYGQGYTAPLAIYAAVLDPGISEIVLADPPGSHEDPATPEFLGILRIGDLPQNLALLYPRPITFVGKIPEAYLWTKQLYEKLGAGDRIRVIDSTRDWQPRE